MVVGMDGWGGVTMLCEVARYESVCVAGGVCGSCTKVGVKERV